MLLAGAGKVWYDRSIQGKPEERTEQAGAQDAHTSAMWRIWDILRSDDPATFAPEVDSRIRATFGTLFADSPPQGEKVEGTSAQELPSSP